MPALVRLLDYLVGCAAVELGVRGTQELLAYLDNPAKTRVSAEGRSIAVLMCSLGAWGWCKLQWKETSCGQPGVDDAE